MFASVSVNMEEEISAIAEMAPKFTVTHRISAANTQLSRVSLSS
jgi:hypothetical protein